MKFNNEFNNNYHSRLIDNIERIYKEILPSRMITKILDLDMYYAKTDEPVNFLDKNKLEYKKIDTHQSWSSRVFDCGWFNLKGVIPKYDRKKDYYLFLDISGEALLFDNHGRAIKGFTNKASVFDRKHGEPGKTIYQINKQLIKDGVVDLWVDGGSNDLFGNLNNNSKIINKEIVSIDLEMKELYFDVEVLYNLLKTLDKEDKMYSKLFYDLQEVYYLVTYEEENYLQKSLLITKKLLSEKSDNNLNLTCIGHAHIDLAWLWPIRETFRKTARTLSNVFYLFKKYPNFKFGMSQPQQVKWLKEKYPNLFKSFKHYVKTGNLELQGKMWVEADTNVPGEESLVRQMLYGHKFWMEEFGKVPNFLWLPDVFGYSGNMPQIIKKSGMDKFMTIKLSWNLINKFPYNSFHWQGVDGTKVLAHIAPEGEYNSSALPQKLNMIDQKYPEKEIAPEALNIFGIGDGGGGPGVEHVERLLREESLYSLPKTEFGNVSSFFDKLSKYENKLPTYEGELYLENHQGCYTSAPNTKKYNHIMQEKLRSFEIYLSQIGKYEKYSSLIQELWEETLLYHFHDILPGSSIMRVYEESDIRYKYMIEKIDSIIDELNNKNKKLYYNPNPYSSYKIVKQNKSYFVYYMDKFSTSNKVEEFKNKGAYNSNIITTNDYTIEFNKTHGYIDSIINNKTRKNILSGKGNKLLLYKDQGNGWDIPEHYRKQTPKLIELVSQEIFDYNRFIEINNTYKYLNSKTIEKVLIDKETSLIYFEHDTDFRDMHKMLRSQFELSYQADFAYFDIQFGEIKRSTKSDTLVDWAKYELPAQQWILQEKDNIGAAILTRGKHGFYVKDNILDVNLVRSSNYPAHSLGIGKTDYGYVFVPYENDHYSAKIDRLSRIYNTHYFNVSSEIKNSLISVDNEVIELSVIKLSEDKKGYIVRLYNPSNMPQDVIVKSDNEMILTNLVEEEIGKTDGVLKLGKYEVSTIKIIRK